MTQTEFEACIQAACTNAIGKPFSLRPWKDSAYTITGKIVECTPLRKRVTARTVIQRFQIVLEYGPENQTSRSCSRKTPTLTNRISEISREQTMTQVQRKLIRAGILSGVTYVSPSEIEVAVMNLDGKTADPDKTEKLRLKVRRVIGWSGFKAGWGGWILRKEEPVEKGDYNNPASKWHY